MQQEVWTRKITAEHREAASEIFRRVRGLTFDPIFDDELILSAQELFLHLDQQETFMGAPERMIEHTRGASSVRE